MSLMYAFKPIKNSAKYSSKAKVCSWGDFTKHTYFFKQSLSRRIQVFLLKLYNAWELHIITSGSVSICYSSSILKASNLSEFTLDWSLTQHISSNVKSLFGFGEGNTYGKQSFLKVGCDQYKLTFRLFGTFPF